MSVDLSIQEDRDTIISSIANMIHASKNDLSIRQHAEQILDEFISRTNHHIWLVVQCAKILKEVAVAFGQDTEKLMLNCEFHDYDKLHNEEIIPIYALKSHYTYYHNEKVDYVINGKHIDHIFETIAWPKHHKKNQHHVAEHFGKKNEHGIYIVPEISPDGILYLIEMYADWMAMGIVKGNDASGWWKKTDHKKWIFTGRDLDVIRACVKTEEGSVNQIAYLKQFKSPDEPNWVAPTEIKTYEDSNPSDINAINQGIENFFDYVSQEDLSLKQDELYIGPIDPTLIDPEKMMKLSEYSDLLLALKKWTTTPDHDLAPELMKLGKIVDDMYKFTNPIICYRGIRTGFSTRPKQNLMGVIDDEITYLRLFKPGFDQPGCTFEFETPEPMSVTRLPYLAKVYGNFIVKTEVPPDANKLVITPELSYILQQMEVEYPQYRAVNLSVTHEVIVFPGQKLQFEVVSTFGDISSELDTMTDKAFEAYSAFSSNKLVVDDIEPLPESPKRKAEYSSEAAHTVIRKELDIGSIADLKVFFSRCRYGLVDTTTGKLWKETHKNTTLQDYYDNWKLLSPSEVVKYKCGICYDTVLLTKTVFDRLNIEYRMYYAYCTKDDGPTHTFVVYRDNNEWRWMEGSWGPFKDNNLTDTSADALVSKIGKILADESGIQQQILKLNTYPKPGITMKEFQQAMLKGSKCCSIDPDKDHQKSNESMEDIRGFESLDIPEDCVVSSEQYDPPYNEEQMREHGYSEEIIERLKKDPIHSWRMKTGIELVHREPTRTELKRIWKNWQQMTPEQKKISDDKCKELFGCDNKTLYEYLLPQYKVESPDKGVVKYPPKSDKSSSESISADTKDEDRGPISESDKKKIGKYIYHGTHRNLDIKSLGIHVCKNRANTDIKAPVVYMNRSLGVASLHVVPFMVGHGSKLKNYEEHFVNLEEAINSESPVEHVEIVHNDPNLAECSGKQEGYIYWVEAKEFLDDLYYATPDDPNDWNFVSYRQLPIAKKTKVTVTWHKKYDPDFAKKVKGGFIAVEELNPSTETMALLTSTPAERHLTNLAKPLYVPIGKNSWEHIQQDVGNAIDIIRTLQGRNLTLKEYAAILFHDCSVKARKSKDRHSYYSAEIARRILSKTTYFTDEDIDEICLAIEEHDVFTNPNGIYSSDLSDLLASADCNPPNVAWILNKSYSRGIENGLTHEERIQHAVESLPKKYGTHGTIVYPKMYAEFNKKAIIKMQKTFDTLTPEECERIIMDYRRRHGLKEGDLSLPDPSLESISSEYVWYSREWNYNEAIDQSFTNNADGEINVSLETMTLLTSTPEEKKLTALAKPLYPPIGTNSWEHIQQDVGNAVGMVKSIYQRNLTLKEYATILFHDCAIKSRQNKERHGYYSAVMAKTILEKTKYFTEEELSEIYTAILEHDTETNPKSIFSSDLSDLLASADFNPPNIAWNLNKSYVWGITHGLDHEERLQNTIKTIPAMYGSHGTVVYPKLYMAYNKDKIKVMQRTLDTLTKEECERIIMDYRQRHGLFDDDIRLPDPSLESIQQEASVSSEGAVDDWWELVKNGKDLPTKILTFLAGPILIPLLALANFIGSIMYDENENKSEEFFEGWEDISHDWGAICSYVNKNMRNDPFFAKTKRNILTMDQYIQQYTIYRKRYEIVEKIPLPNVNETEQEYGERVASSLGTTYEKCDEFVKKFNTLDMFPDPSQITYLQAQYFDNNKVSQAMHTADDAMAKCIYVSEKLDSIKDKTHQKVLDKFGLLTVYEECMNCDHPIEYEFGYRELKKIIDYLKNKTVYEKAVSNESMSQDYSDGIRNIDSLPSSIQDASKQSISNLETISVEALAPDIKKKKQLITDYICSVCDIMDPTKLNSNRYHRLLDHMTDKEFDQWMNYVKEGKWKIHILAPNLVVKLTSANNLKAADKIKCKLFHKLWMKDASTGREYLTDNEYLILNLPIRRQQQFLDEKMSVPDNDRQIDGMTGQVTGDSKSSSVTNPEIQILAFRGLDATLEEFVNVRGGNIAAYSDFKRQAEETGEIKLNSLDPNTRSRVAVVGQVLLRSMMIDNNIVE